MHVDMSVKKREQPQVQETWQQHERDARANLKSNPKTALQDIDRALRLADSDNARATCYATKADIYCALSNRVSALSYLNQALSCSKASSGSSGIYARFYAFYVDGKQYQEAEQFFTRELNANKEHPFLQLLLGMVYRQQKTYDKAEPLLQAAVRHNYDAAVVPLALNYLATGKADQAETLLTPRYLRLRQKGIVRTEDDVREIVILAQVFVHTRTIEDAARLIKQESPFVDNQFGRTHPAALSLIDLFGTLCLLQGHYDEAEKWRAESDLRRRGQRVSEPEEMLAFDSQCFVIGGSLKTVHDFLYQDKLAEAMDFADAQARELEAVSDPLLPLFIFQAGLLQKQRADAERQARKPDEEAIKSLLIGRKNATGTRTPNGALHRFVAVAVTFAKSAYAKDACLHEDEIITLLNARYGTALRSSIPAEYRAGILK